MGAAHEIVGRSLRPDQGVLVCRTEIVYPVPVVDYEKGRPVTVMFM
jgi:hypothetical protein